MDLQALIDNFDAFKARLDTLETDLSTKNAELEKVTQNRDSILKEKRRLENRDFDGLDERIRKSVFETDVSSVVTISREDAREGGKYREAKAAAERAGVPLRIVDENAPAAAFRTSPVRLIHDETSGILHANKRMIIATPGGLPRLRQLAAEKHSQLRLFRTVDDLPRDAAAKHAQIIADQVQDNLLGDEQ